MYHFVNGQTANAREINQALAEGKYVYETGRIYNTRIIKARTVKGQLQGKALSSGKWVSLRTINITLG